MVLDRSVAEWRGWSAALVVVLAACGGGRDGDAAVDGAASGPLAVAGAIQPGELPSELLLAEPRNENRTSHIALAWSSEGAFSGSIVARIEHGLMLVALDTFTLQQSGAPVVYGAPGDEGPVPFELRYADGFFLLTAQSDSPFGLQGLFGVDIFPPEVTPVPPAGVPPCPGDGVEECSNSMGFIAMSDWPRRTGQSVSSAIPRDDPAMLTYDVLIKRTADDAFFATLVGASGQIEPRLPRGLASGYDFPTARIKVRGCNAAGECVESPERSLQSALVNGVIPIDSEGPAPNAQVALSGDGDRMAFGYQQSGAPAVLMLQRQPEQGRWINRATIQNPAPGFGRTLAFSDDGSALAVEASPCAVNTVVCEVSSVFVYAIDELGFVTEQARFDGLRAPRLSAQGDHLLGIGVGAQRANTVAVFERRATWQAVPFPALGYTPLDIALSARELTLAVARQGTLADPCGCRAVVVYDFAFDLGVWSQTAVLRSSKRLDTVGSPDDDGFGFVSGTSQSLAVSGDGSIVAVGASLDSSDASDTVGDPGNHHAPSSGAIYVFRRQPDNSFVKEAFVKAGGAAPLDHFGHSVALNTTGERLLAGARGVTPLAAGVNRNYSPAQALPTATPGVNGALTGAAAYVFELVGGRWVEQAKMLAPNADTANFDTFYSLSVSSSNAAIVLGTGVPDPAGGLARRFFVY